jgi:hypothetical protein
VEGIAEGTAIFGLGLLLRDNAADLHRAWLEACLRARTMAQEWAALRQPSLTGAQSHLGGARESPGDRPPDARSVASEFAGILQGKLRQRVTDVRMLKLMRV